VKVIPVVEVLVVPKLYPAIVAPFPNPGVTTIYALNFLFTT